MIYYNLHSDVLAATTCSDDSPGTDIITPLRQTHSTKVASIPEEAASTDGIDALITATPGIAIGVRTADCVPVLVYDPTSRSAAAIHSGWKGTLHNIIATTIQKLNTKYGALSSDMVAVVGPSIHIDAFEVDDDVYRMFAEAGYGNFCHRMSMPGETDNTKWHIDLPGICKHQLEESGVAKTELRPECTYSDPSQFFSWRRDGQSLGNRRHVSFIKML